MTNVQIITIEYNYLDYQQILLMNALLRLLLKLQKTIQDKLRHILLNNVIDNIVYNVFPVFYWFFTSQLRYLYNQ